VKLFNISKRFDGKFNLWKKVAVHKLFPDEPVVKTKKGRVHEYHLVPKWVIHSVHKARKEALGVIRQETN
jgi:hypothetical protein